MKTACSNEEGEFLVEVCQSCGDIIAQGHNLCVRHRGYRSCASCEALRACKEQVMAGGLCYCEILSKEDMLIVELRANGNILSQRTSDRT